MSTSTPTNYPGLYSQPAPPAYEPRESTPIYPKLKPWLPDEEVCECLGKVRGLADEVLSHYGMQKTEWSRALPKQREASWIYAPTIYDRSWNWGGSRTEHHVHHHYGSEKKDEKNEKATKKDNSAFFILAGVLASGCLMAGAWALGKSHSHLQIAEDLTEKVNELIPGEEYAPESTKEIELILKKSTKFLNRYKQDHAEGRRPKMILVAASVGTLAAAFLKLIVAVKVGAFVGILAVAWIAYNAAFRYSHESAIKRDALELKTACDRQFPAWKWESPTPSAPAE